MAVKILLVVILAVWVGMQMGRLVTLWELRDATPEEFRGIDREEDKNV